MTSVEERVLQETLRFREALPELLRQHPGKWVVFRDGKVESVHETEEEAYIAGLDRFGRDGGHVVIQVVDQKPLALTAGVVFGIA